ncbi:Panacea domain-containing protein [Fusobacterium nucleatum]|uniref:Panacea domain-containing protein n=1 Tax=Fusobacterium nucleatum TaxID=851 RepID=UPI0030D2BA9A
MERILDIAKYLTKKYKDEKKEEIDELKLHKILYFSQKKYIMLTNDFLFEEDFEGWYLGPINKLVRKEYKFIKIGKEDISLKDIEKKIIDRVFDRYKDMNSYKLSDLSHKEYSWIKSRIGLKRGEKGNQKLLKEDIKIDAERYKKQLIADKKEELLEI